MLYFVILFVVVVVVVIVVVVVDLWRPFLKEYALLHPGLMDDSSYPQGMGVSSLSRKRERPEEEELTGSERTSIDKLPR